VVRADREAVLVYSTAWAPGWRAAVDQRPSRVIRVDGTLLGVVVPSGTSSVVLDYRPVGWQIGWPVSLAAVVLLALWAGVRRKMGR
jgi:uncharacterized membrane protein YfhO